MECPTENPENHSGRDFQADFVNEDSLKKAAFDESPTLSLYSYGKVFVKIIMPPKTRETKLCMGAAPPAGIF